MEHSYCNETRRLAQGTAGRVSGTNKIFFINEMGESGTKTSHIDALCVTTKEEGQK